VRPHEYPPIWRTSLQASMAVWVAPERAFCVPAHADAPRRLKAVQPVLCLRMPGYVVDGETTASRSDVVGILVARGFC